MKLFASLTLLGAACVAATPTPVADPPVCSQTLGGSAVGLDLQKATGVKLGPKPTGCADLEVLIGEISSSHCRLLY